MGTPNFPSAQDECAECLNDKHKDYIARLKDKLAKLSKSDRQWWRLNRELINKKTKINSIPPLKGDDGIWHIHSLDKANVLASKFDAKCQLPPEVEDQYVARPEHKQNIFFCYPHAFNVEVFARIRCLMCYWVRPIGC